MGRFSFDGLETIERMIRRCGDETCYIRVWDRTAREKEDALDRFDFTAASASSFLSSMEDDEEDDDEPEDDDEERDEYDFARAFHAQAARTRPAPKLPEDKAELRKFLAETACRWLRVVAQRNSIGEPCRRFRVKIYGPKGLNTNSTGSFSCTDENAADQAAQMGVLVPQTRADLQVPPPSFEVAEAVAATQGMRALGDFYSQWGRMVLGSVHELQGVSNAMIVKLHDQLDGSRDQVDQLVAAVIQQRVAEVEAAEQRQVNTRQDDTRAEVAKHAIAQLADAAKVMLGARGLPPELAEVAGVLGQHPELVALLTDPNVRKLLSDPAQVQMAVNLLRELAANAAGGAQAA